MSVKVLGLEGTKEMIAGLLPREAKNILRRTTLAIASEVRNEVRQRAPKQTGALRKGIKSKRDKGSPTSISASVYADRSGGPSGRAYHWHFLEFGTTKMPAQPFLNPTVEEFRPKMPEMYREKFGKQLEKELQKKAKRARR